MAQQHLLVLISLNAGSLTGGDLVEVARITLQVVDMLSRSQLISSIVVAGRIVGLLVARRSIAISSRSSSRLKTSRSRTAAFVLN